jgi:hypothetical protein
MMATVIYTTKSINLLDGEEVELGPLKIKYLKEFMQEFVAVILVDQYLQSMGVNVFKLA